MIGGSTSIGTSSSIGGSKSTGSGDGAGTGAGGSTGALTAAIAGRELRRTLVPRRDAEGGYESGSRSGVSLTTGGRTESPTAMMRIAKIADDEGGVELGAAEIGAASLPLLTSAGGGGSLRGRGGGGSLRGRGTAADSGRGGVDAAFNAFSAAARASSSSTEPRAEPNVGSDGGRPATSFASALNDGFERRRGIGGG